MRLGSAAEKLSEEEQVKFLAGRGWFITKPSSPKIGNRPARMAQWTHPLLEFPWPQADALRLELEEQRSVYERGGVG